MPDENDVERIKQIEQKITTLTTQLAESRAIVQRWEEAGASLSLSAAEARAKNQDAGRGILGAILGSKFRGAMRAGAAASNASIAKDVAAKRSQIAEGKREAQVAVRLIQAELSEAKQELKSLTSKKKQAATSETRAAKAAADLLALLQKLKEAKDAGLLTEQEYEEKRKKLVSGL